MTARGAIVGFFVVYAVLLPVLAREFVAEYTSAATAMMACALVIAFLFWSKRAFFFNLLIALYVFQNYLTRPYISILEGGLSVQSRLYMRDLRAYDTPDTAAVVYWSLFSLLLTWALGLLLFRSPRSRGPVSIPRFFARLDSVLLRNGLPFIAGVALLFALNYQSPGAGLRSGTEGGGDGSFMLGVASLATVNLACLFAYLRERHAGRTNASYLLLVPVVLAIGAGLLQGSRSAAFQFVLLGSLYWLLLEWDRKWELLAAVRAASVTAVLLLVTVGVGLFAQFLRPLMRYSSSLDFTDLFAALSYTNVIGTGDILLRGLTELLYRLSSLKAQFYILNDWYVHEPWQHYNPAVSMMRVINALVPGDAFPGMLSINQLWDYVYTGVLVNYNSEMWGLQGTLYLYFGHVGAPVVVLALAVIANRTHPWIERSVRTSPVLASLVIPLVLDTLTNGTVERIIPENFVRPVVSLFIFSLIYRLFSLMLPSRIRWWTPAGSVP